MASNTPAAAGANTNLLRGRGAAGYAVTPPTGLLLIWIALTAVTAAHAGMAWNTLLSCGLSVTVLSLSVWATAARDWRLVWIIFVLYFGVGWINILDEAVLFQILPLNIAFQSLTFGATTAFSVAVLLALAMKRMGGDLAQSSTSHPKTTSLAWIWKASIGGCLYFVLYCAAGAIVHPFIKAFYKGHRLPSFGELFVIQFFRGVLYVLVAFPFARIVSIRRIYAASILGLCLSVLGGLAPLSLSNPYMPISIRIAHSFEVGISNFVYGFILGYLIIPSNAQESYAETTSW